VAAPLVSVIVLNLDGEAIVGRCLDHLLAQTHPRVEIIVVDNGSSDGSLAVLERYVRTGRVSVVRNASNLGVPGGRNQGVLYARGDVVAFMDNDGYAAPTWLEAALRTLETDDRIGAVAPAVFFNKRKIILNGVGATINRQGYGGDLCFNQPYEFAAVPGDVLYPMGCGMVIRRSVMDRIAPLDDILVNYYDDTEVGIRIWKLGYRVVTAPESWVDHDFSYSDRLLRNKVLLCERNRIRTVLKYYPLRRLAGWLLRDVQLFRYCRTRGLRTIPWRAWAWNLRHMASALYWRARFGFGPAPFWPLVDPSWGSFPRPAPDNQAFRPRPTAAAERLLLDGVGDRNQLNFGWYYPERDGPDRYRWTDAHASAFLRLRRPPHTMTIRRRAAGAGQRATVAIRRLGELDPALRIRIDSGRADWHETRHPVALAPGDYEWLLTTAPTLVDASQRSLGTAVSWVRFE
jgi:GT2 family glycosyltransferase